MKSTILPAVLFSALLSGAADTNYWVGPSNGEWGADANWSLGHVPTATEHVDFTNDTALTVQVGGDYFCGCYYVNTLDKKAPITFTGGGSITASGSSGHYSKKPIVLDGVTMALNGRETLFYANLTLRNGAKLTTNGQNVYAWGGNAEFTVEDGEISCGPLGYASTPAVVTLKQGKITCTAFKEVSRSQTGRCQLAIESGEFTCSGDFVLTNSTSFAISGGALTVGGKITIMDTVTLSLTDGAITNASPITRTQKRLITESKGTSLTTTAADTAADLFDTDDETLVFHAPFAAPNGAFVLTNRVTLVSDYPFVIQRFLYGAGATEASIPCTFRLTNLVARGYQLFQTNAGGARNFNIDGPLTLRPSVESMQKTSSKTTYVLLDGELTVDTRDVNDPTLARAMAFRNFGSRNGNGSLVVRGGGSLYLTQTYANPFRKLVVETGTTLEVGPFENLEYGPINAENLVLGPSSVLKIQAGTNTVHAGTVSIDPTARIEVTIPADYTAVGTSILRDSSGTLGDISSQVVLSGAGAAGWKAVSMGGVLAVVKPVATVDGTYPQEWTGAAGNGYWSNANNWYNQTAPVKDDKTSVCAFGCSDTQLDTNYDTGGAYLGRLFFRDTAVKSFTVTSSGERTFFCYGTTIDNSPSVGSLSAVPQYVSMRFRRTGTGNAFTWVAEDAPLVIASPLSYPPLNGVLGFSGDIRVSGQISWPRLAFYAKCSPKVAHSTLTVLSGGVVTVTNQTSDFSASYVAFVVRAGGKLHFKGLTDDAIYRWRYAPCKHIVDGEMRIDAPYCGGKSQVYGGSGKLILAANCPETAASALTLSDTLTAELSSDWVTVKSGADYPLTLNTASFSSPTVKLSANWTYGPAADAQSASAASARAFELARGSVLTIDAGGYTATFADPVAGEGTLAIANGTLSLAGGVATNVTLRLDSSGVFVPAVGQQLGGMIANGGTIRVADGDPVVVTGNLDASALLVADNGSQRWTTRIIATGTITGVPATTEQTIYRVVTLSDGRSALQSRTRYGFLLLFR